MTVIIYVSKSCGRCTNSDENDMRRENENTKYYYCKKLDTYVEEHWYCEEGFVDVVTKTNNAKIVRIEI